MVKNVKNRMKRDAKTRLRATTPGGGIRVSKSRGASRSKATAMKKGKEEEVQQALDGEEIITGSDIEGDIAVADPDGLGGVLSNDSEEKVADNPTKKGSKKTKGAGKSKPSSSKGSTKGSSKGSARGSARSSRASSPKPRTENEEVDSPKKEELYRRIDLLQKQQVKDKLNKEHMQQKYEEKLKKKGSGKAGKGILFR